MISKKLISLILFCFLAGQVLACAPSDVVYISDTPDVDNPFMVMEEDSFMNGQYGIISDWDLPYLYHVYRTLNGQEFTEDEIESFLPFYKNFFGNSSLYYWNERAASNNLREAVNEWRNARELINQEYVPISVYKQGDNKY